MTYIPERNGLSLSHVYVNRSTFVLDLSGTTRHLSPSYRQPMLLNVIFFHLVDLILGKNNYFNNFKINSLSFVRLNSIMPRDKKTFHGTTNQTIRTASFFLLKAYVGARNPGYQSASSLNGMCEVAVLWFQRTATDGLFLGTIIFQSLFERKLHTGRRHRHKSIDSYSILYFSEDH